MQKIEEKLNNEDNFARFFQCVLLLKIKYILFDICNL